MQEAKPEQEWLEHAQALMLRGELARAEALISDALKDYPSSFALRRILAGIRIQAGREAEGEALLTQLFAERPEEIGNAFTLARTLANQSKGAAAARVLRTHFQRSRTDPELAIQAIELLDDCGRKRDAAEIAELAVAAAPEDFRLYAYAGMLESQLGNFPQARARYLRAMDAPLACEWHMPLGLALMQRYHDAQHPDFALFRDCLARGDLSAKARSSLLFAFAKAYDDIGEYARAASYSREANALAHAATKWSRENWRMEVEARLNAGPIDRAEPLADFNPIFIVGLPRSGTTLVAELLAHFPQVCNRGESPWLATLAEQGSPRGQPHGTTLQNAAVTYATHMRRDDAPSSRWFIDKQPLNLRYIDLILALFPNARIVHCTRNPRDNALSLWMQSFSEDVQGYAYDFSDMAFVMQDCARLMSQWRTRYQDTIHEVKYEQLVASPSHVIADLAGALGLAPQSSDQLALPATPGEISSASLWQARQPIYARSVDRWKNYIRFLPELLGFPACEPAQGTDQPDWNSR